MLYGAAGMNQFLDTIAILALVTIISGAAMRVLARTLLAQFLLGTLFGGVAIVVMWDTFSLADGVIVDLRHVAVTLAAAFLGLPGAIAATLMALMMRVGIGGVGMTAGSASIVIAALVGLMWRASTRASDRQVRDTLLLAALSQLSMATILLLPWDVAWQIVREVWPTLAPLSFAGVFVLATLLKHEQTIVDEARRLSEGGVAHERPDPLRV